MLNFFKLFFISSLFLQGRVLVFAADELVVTEAGWKTPIQFVSTDFSEPIGFANTAISGIEIEEFVHNPKITIRADGNSCVSCHGGPGTLLPHTDFRDISKENFCLMLPEFIRSKKKPVVLKVVFEKWLHQNCND